jgi:magnesium-transporting ATPase (P-type)
MKRKPRTPEEKIFDRHMIGQTLVSGLAIGALAFAFWYWMIKVQTLQEASARNIILLLMVLLQNVHVFNCRSEKVSAFMIPLQRNFILVFGVLAAQGIHILSMNAPFMQGILGTEPVHFNQWLIALALALIVLVVMEMFKWVTGRRHVAG